MIPVGVERFQRKRGHGVGAYESIDILHIGVAGVLGARAGPYCLIVGTPNSRGGRLTVNTITRIHK
jgi:hypothetical protein